MGDRMGVACAQVESSLKIVGRRSARAPKVEGPSVGYGHGLGGRDGAGICTSALGIGIGNFVADITICEEFAVLATVCRVDGGR